MSRRVPVPRIVGGEELRRQVALCGRVTFAATGQAVIDPVIQLNPESTDVGRDATLRPNGIYFYLDLPAGRYVVRAEDRQRRCRAEATADVTWDDSGRIQAAVADLAMVEQITDDGGRVPVVAPTTAARAASPDEHRKRRMRRTTGR